jgi:hypothetical protein
MCSVCLRTDLYIKTFCSLAALRFRFRQQGYDKKQFCREFRVFSEHYIPELFYDCLWTKSNYEGTPFTFEYEAASTHHSEVRRYVTMLPFYKNIGMCKCKTTISYFYLCTVHVVTFTLLKTNSCTFFNTFTFTLKHQKNCQKCSVKASYINKKPYMFWSLFQDHLQGSPFALSAPTTLQLHASSFVFVGLWSYALYLYVYPVYLPVCCLVVQSTTRQHTGRYTGYTYK